MDVSVETKKETPEISTDPKENTTENTNDLVETKNENTNENANEDSKKIAEQIWSVIEKNDVKALEILLESNKNPVKLKCVIR